jgi:uncharacterized membrane protein
MKQIITIALAFILALTAVTALPIGQITVDIDDITLNENAVNRLSLERGHNYDVRVRFTAEADLRDVQIRTFLSGYEFSDIDDIHDKTPLFDVQNGVTYVKKLNLKFPNDIDEDDYKLRIIITDRFNEEITLNYNLKVDVPRNSLVIEDVIFSPSNSVRAGSALLAKVRVENRGQQDQNDVKVTVSIPQLSVSGTAYIEEVDSGDDEEETEEIFIRVPKCTPAGNYDVTIDVEYQQLHRKVSTKRTIAVLEDDTCKEDKTAPTTIQIGSQTINVIAGQMATFPITLTNTGKKSQSFTINVQSNEVASVTITPSNLVVVPAGQTQQVFVNAQVNEKASAGAHQLAATIQNGDSTQQVNLNLMVTNSQVGTKRIVEVVLIALVIILVVIAIVLGISYVRGKGQTETYY